MQFPLPFRPTLSYKTGGRKFGAPRNGGKRQHAACDLIAPLGTEILAVDDGIVEAGYSEFYHHTGQLVVRHQGNYVVRYCEILREHVPGVKKGGRVQAGQVIAHIGKMHTDSMLHFELYRGDVGGPLTQRQNGPFQRRSDLIDPTSFLDRLIVLPVRATSAA